MLDAPGPARLDDGWGDSERGGPGRREGEAAGVEVLRGRPGREEEEAREGGRHRHGWQGTARMATGVLPSRQAPPR